MNTFLALPIAVRLAIGALVVVQLSLQVWSIMDLVRRPPTSGNQKLVWVLIVLFANLVGAVVYLAVGRKSLDDLAAREAAQAREGTSRGGERARTIDRLYGDRDA